ncbi:hypothetical protein TMatcc_006686 [Talaromyces marneffei ATCC 18224]
MIGGCGFMRLVKQQKNKTFFTSLHEIDKIIEDESKTKDELELDEIWEKLPFPYLKEFADVFSKRESDKLPISQPYDHKIELEKPNELSYHPLYKMSLDELEAAREYIIDNLNKGFIEPSNAPFASPIIMAEKPGGGLRFCVDYRKLNQLTKKDRYPLPLIDEVFERLNRARIFTKLDIRQGFHRIRMHPESEDLTTFRCRYGTYKYKVMPFGLTNGPATFQRLVNDLFMDCLDQFLIAFVDDLLIYSENEIEHEIHVKRVLERLREAGLQAAIHKCEFHVTRTKFLGFILTPEGIEVDQEKIKAIKEWQVPTTVFGVRSFLGFCGFYRKFIQGYSRIVKPLNYLTRQDVSFKWTGECREAFEKLKKYLASAPILYHYRPELPCRLETDASDGVVAAVFSQLQDDGQWHPVAYYSRTMNSAEFNYDIHDKEMLAIVDALKEWRAELIGLQREERFEILSDHLALQYFMTTKKLTSRQARWCELLNQYYFIIKHRPGKENTLADALTRKESPQVDRKGQREQLMLPSACLGPSEVRDTLGTTAEEDTELTDSEDGGVELSLMEPATSILTRVISANMTSSQCEEYRELAQNGNENWSMEGTLLQFKGRIYVPDEGDLRARLLDEIHRQPSTAHPGKNKMKILRTNTRRDLPPGLLQPLPIPARPWQHISMDFMTYPPDKAGYDTVFVVVDRLSKTPISTPCHKNVDARELARLWIKYVYPRTGLPDSIVSDRGPQFVSEFWGEVCRILSIKVVLLTAAYAQTDRQTEIANQYLSQRLRPYVNHHQDDWSEWISIIDFAAAALPQDSTGLSPFMVEKGFQPRMSFDWKEPESPARLTINERQAREWMKRLQSVWDFARSNIKRAQQRQKVKKLDHQAAGPFQIVSKVGHAYKLKLDDGINVHPVFAPEKLRRASSSELLTGQIQDKAPPIEVNGEQEWEVDEILDSKLRWRKLFYRVRWTGHDPDPKWYLASNFKNASRRLKAFHDRYPEKPGPPVNLQRWLDAESRDEFVGDDSKDACVAVVGGVGNAPSAWGQAFFGGGGNVTAVREVIRKQVRFDVRAVAETEKRSPDHVDPEHAGRAAGRGLLLSREHATDIATGE